MIKGIGIDMIETDRVGEKIAKNEGFREYVFTPVEIAYCEMKANKAEHYAARFAGKEALLKALGVGFSGGLALNEIEISGDENGKPEITFTGETAKKIKESGELKIHISLSHLKNIASAMVIIEKL
ncbi:MAG TPA: holo-ACP synthase [Bacteroidia bacterium]|nr:holo-ACP synthase [Bacteroidia bacterium]